MVRSLWPKAGKVLLAAQYKAGKSTLRDNAVRCLADGGQFLRTLWKMVAKTRTQPRSRYFSAFGRDVDVQECELSYDATTRSLTITRGSRKQSVTEHAWYAIGKYIKEHPDLSQAAVIKAFGKDQDEYEVIAERTVRDAIRLGFKYGERISQEHAVGKAMKLRWYGSDPAGGEQP